MPLEPTANSYAVLTAAPSEISVGPPFQAIHLVAVLVRLLPNWLPERPQVFKALLDRWHHPARLHRLQNEADLPLVQLLESKWLAKCILAYIGRHHEETQALLDLFSIFSVSA